MSSSLSEIAKSKTDIELRSKLKGVLTEENYSWVLPILESSLWDFCANRLLEIRPTFESYSCLAGPELLYLTQQKISDLKNLQSEINTLESQALFLALDYYIADSLRKNDITLLNLRVAAEKSLAKLQSTDSPTKEDIEARRKLLEDAFNARLAAHSVQTSSLNFARRSQQLRELFVIEIEAIQSLFSALIRAMALTYGSYINLPATFESESEFTSTIDAACKFFANVTFQAQHKQREFELHFFIDADGLNRTTKDDIRKFGDAPEFDEMISALPEAPAIISTQAILSLRRNPTLTFEISDQHIRSSTFQPSGGQVILKEIAFAFVSNRDADGFMVANHASNWRSAPNNTEKANIFSAEESWDSIYRSELATTTVQANVLPPTQSLLRNEMDKESFKAFGRKLEIFEYLPPTQVSVSFLPIGGTHALPYFSGRVLTGCNPVGRWSIEFDSRTINRFGLSSNVHLSARDILVSLRLIALN